MPTVSVWFADVHDPKGFDCSAVRNERDGTRKRIANGRMQLGRRTWGAIILGKRGGKKKNRDAKRTGSESKGHSIRLSVH